MQEAGQSCLITPSVTVKWKKLSVGGEKKCKYHKFSLDPFSYSSLLPVILIRPDVYLSLHSWAFSRVNQNFKFTEMKNIPSLWLLTLGRSSLFIHLRKHKERKPLCFSLHCVLNSGVMTEDCHSSSIVYVGKKFHRGKSFNLIIFCGLQTSRWDCNFRVCMCVTDTQPENGSFPVPYITLPDNSDDRNTSLSPPGLLLSVATLFCHALAPSSPSYPDF